MKTKYLLFLVLLAVFVGIVYAGASSLTIAKKTSCNYKTIIVEETEPVYETVTDYNTKWRYEERYNPENDSTYITAVEDGREEYQVRVQTGTRKMTKEKTVCDDTSKVEVVADGKSLILDYLSKNFQCGEAVNGKIECDSKLDGNGDGICKSGESCYIISQNNGCVQIEEKNSLNKGTTTTETTSNGVCIKIISDNTFKQKWHLIGGGVAQ